MKKILVIIVTYNGSKWIENCIDSVVNSSLASDVFIVDNCSSDDTVSIIENKYANFIILHKSKINLGFGKGNNIGLKYALANCYDYVFLLNQDAFLEKDTLKRMIAVSESNAGYGILSPIHLNADGNQLEMYFSQFVNYQNNPHFYSDFVMIKEVKDVYDFKFISAAAWLLPLTTLKNIGGFDPLFWHYGEDDNYCQRVLYHNLKIGVVPNTFVRHDTKIRQYNLDYLYSTRYFQDYEKDLQVKYGNINYQTHVDILLYERKKLVKCLYLSFARFDFRDVKATFRKLKSVKRIIDQIGESRNINVSMGSHYIE